MQSSNKTENLSQEFGKWLTTGTDSVMVIFV